MKDDSRSVLKLGTKANISHKGTFYQPVVEVHQSVSSFTYLDIAVKLVQTTDNIHWNFRILYS